MLTDMACKKAKQTDKLYRLLDQSGLYLAVHPNGSKYWQYRFKLEGKQHSYSLGTYPMVSLLDARNEHARLREQVKKGINPVKEKKLQKLARNLEQVLTFEALAIEWFEGKQREVVAKTATVIWGILTNHVFPFIGDLEVKEVKPIHVLTLLKELESAGKMTVAVRARQIVGEVFRYGVVTLRCETDPSAPLAGYIKKPPVQHAKALSREEMQTLLCRFAQYQGKWVTKEFVLFHMLAFTRSIETSGAKWSEIDFDAKLWRIPAERMKMRRPHVVPLSDLMIRLLKSVHNLTSKWEYVFPGTDKRYPIAANTINAALRYSYGDTKAYGIVTSHDFRATASTWLYEAGFLADAIELQLAHAKKSKVVGTYNQAEHLERRREFMEWYSNQLLEICPQAFEPRF